MVVYDGVLAPLSTKSSDLRAQDGRLVQVKSRVVVCEQSGNFSFFRSWAFDVCVFVKFDSESTTSFQRSRYLLKPCGHSRQ
jgi:hypothetical protein